MCVWQPQCVLLQVCQQSHPSLSPIQISHTTHAISPLLPIDPLPPTHRLCVGSVRDRRPGRHCGPDGVSPSCLGVCADQLATIFTQICTTHSAVFPRNHPSITGFNDYRPIALFSVVMKSYKRLVLVHLKDITGTSAGPPVVCSPGKRVIQLTLPASNRQRSPNFLTDMTQQVRLG